MAKYLYNTTNSIYLFKGGSLEVPPKGTKPVSDTDFASGMFEDAILTGAIKAYDRQEDVETSKVVTKPNPVEVMNKGDSGASQDELKAFLAKQESKRQAEADRLKAAIATLESEAITDPTPEPKIEEEVVEPAASTKKGRKAQTTDTTDTAAE
jgi:hypothetical protein